MKFCLVIVVCWVVFVCWWMLRCSCCCCVMVWLKVLIWVLSWWCFLFWKVGCWVCGWCVMVIFMWLMVELESCMNIVLIRVLLISCCGRMLRFVLIYVVVWLVSFNWFFFVLVFCMWFIWSCNGLCVSVCRCLLVWRIVSILCRLLICVVLICSRGGCICWFDGRWKFGWLKWCRIRCIVMSRVSSVFCFISSVWLVYLLFIWMNDVIMYGRICCCFVIFSLVSWLCRYFCSMSMMFCFWCCVMILVWCVI